jgi:beta-lactamase class A
MKKIIVLLSLTICLAAAFYFSQRLYHFRAKTQIKHVVPAAKSYLPKTWGELAKRTAAWKSLKKELADEMKGFNGNVGLVVKDLDMNWEINSSKELPIPSASLVKIPIMLSYYYAANEGKVDLRTKIELKNAYKAPGSGILKTAASGQAFSVEDLITIMITESDNTAANMLIDFLGLDALNGYFAKLGLKYTNLSRKMMDFKGRKKGVENYTTTREMAHLLEMVYRGKFLNPAVSRKCLEILASQKVNDRIPKELPAGTIAAHKTGLEDGLCHDVGIVYTGKGAYLICVLTKHGYTSAKTAKKMIARMSLHTYNYYNSL